MTDLLEQGKDKEKEKEKARELFAALKEEALRHGDAHQFGEYRALK